MSELQRTHTSASALTTIVVRFNAEDGSGSIKVTRGGRTVHSHVIVREQDSPRGVSDDD